MNLQNSNRQDIQNDISLRKIFYVSAIVAVILGVFFFIYGNIFSTDKAKASGTPKTYEISGNSSNRSNKNILKGLNDGDTLKLVGDLYIDKECKEMNEINPVIKMEKGNLIFKKDVSLYLGKSAVILCRSGYHIMVEDLGTTGCDDMSVGNTDKDDSDSGYDCKDENCPEHQKGSKSDSTASSSYKFSVSSTNGYTVNMVITPTVINVPTSCSNGYNFTVDLKYDISFTGSNIPSAMYTLQGNLICDDDEDNFLQLPTKGGSGTSTTSNSWRSKKDCGSITVATLCKELEITIQGPNLSTQKMSCELGKSYVKVMTDDDNDSRIFFGGEQVISPYGSDAAISFCLASHSGWDNGKQTLLPVELVSFDATVVNNQVELKWVTASEENNSHFEIQRSVNGTDFEVLDEVLGHGNSMVMLNYSYIDKTAPMAEKHIYYRLKQIDYNGDFEFTPLIALSTSSVPEQSGKVYPNPANGQITIEHNSDDFNIVIINQSGSVVFEEMNVKNRKTINTSFYPRGYYVVQIYNDRIKESHKVLISH